MGQGGAGSRTAQTHAWKAGREACCYKPVKEKKGEGPRYGQLGGNGEPADAVTGAEEAEGRSAWDDSRCPSG